MKVYMVSFDGYRDVYGSYIYLLGIYSSREKAEEAAKKAVADMGDIVITHPINHAYDTEKHRPIIREINIDESRRIFDDGYEFATDKCLGGYCDETA